MAVMTKSMANSRSAAIKTEESHANICIQFSISIDGFSPAHSWFLSIEFATGRMAPQKRRVSKIKFSATTSVGAARHRQVDP